MKKTLIAFAIGFASVLSPQAATLDIWFDDEASAELTDYPTAVDGRYKPFESLTAFDTLLMPADWWLSIEDAGNFGGENSVLTQWQLEIDGSLNDGIYTLNDPVNGIIPDGSFEDFLLSVPGSLGSVLDVNVHIVIEGGNFSDLGSLAFYLDPNDPSGNSDRYATLFDFGHLGAVPDALPGVVPAISLFGLVAADAMRRRMKK